ncbi:MAG TPA: UDP-glucose 4-epimerase [Myxococcales bacterium]|nr:UDP-glucose 4-epimerase [Deltaproteobacteria bacterium]MBU51395.1 UDP-glucose 4-epimerase [Deltaproteobacteria bacterium]HAA53963.1 UDP-glucose 4-epimerase [Myxococcales bacterium]|tara:strand:- start:2558 stop:3490 length:933 start_codon:yes stop_codon:yes gene_type:complete
MQKILVTGALGQIGVELIDALRKTYGKNHVIASDLRADAENAYGPYEQLDVLDTQKLTEVIKEHKITRIYHLAALLSAVGEHHPLKAWDVNMTGTLNVYEAARHHGVESVFVPSSIGAFGASTPLDQTPQDTIQRPSTMYGITKVAGELLGDYYANKFGLDCRGLRFPGLISYLAPPGGGTTDYAVEIFHYAVKGQPYTCYLRPDTSLDMMYMPDALQACIQLMEAPADQLIHRNAFNVTAMQFTPEQLTAEIQKHVPDFTINYEVDPIRQSIADSWPNSMDDSAARQEWGWSPEYDLSKMVAEMLKHLR